MSGKRSRNQRGHGSRVVKRQDAAEAFRAQPARHAAGHQPGPARAAAGLAQPPPQLGQVAHDGERHRLSAGGQAGGRGVPGQHRIHPGRRGVAAERADRQGRGAGRGSVVRLGAARTCCPGASRACRAGAPGCGGGAWMRQAGRSRSAAPQPASPPSPSWISCPPPTRQTITGPSARRAMASNRMAGSDRVSRTRLSAVLAAAWAALQQRCASSMTMTRSGGTPAAA